MLIDETGRDIDAGAVWWGLLVVGTVILIVLAGSKQSDPNFKLQKAKEQGYWEAQLQRAYDEGYKEGLK